MFQMTEVAKHKSLVPRMASLCGKTLSRSELKTLMKAEGSKGKTERA